MSGLREPDGSECSGRWRRPTDRFLPRLRLAAQLTHGPPVADWASRRIRIGLTARIDPALHRAHSPRYGCAAGRAAAEAFGLSRKLRTSQGRVVELSTRGNPRESATETNRQCRPSHVNGWQAR